ncbi:rolling circle replication-associated protein [Bradyrhizobium iriomotense]|uniref:rolling circle replication-associated protein n=1 Tax=Bradyrhizobium iriomotense TaxID=441950 RepID=UPI001B8A69EA|nr:hypothetical protein [Bradyrhizobium iriomotense]MBR1134130.1 hypothetical protein [Bradyrhizobium iriomotense]
MRRLVRRAMAKGAVRKTATLWEWDIAGRCEAPITRELWSRPSSSTQALAARRNRRNQYEIERHAREEWGSSADDDEWVPPPFEPKGFPRMVRGGPGFESLLQLRMHVRCRKCERCRRMRRADWFERAKAELQQAERSWFVTLTFNDITQFKALALARKKATARSLVWETLTPDVQFTLHAAAAYTEYVQKFWKRVRKSTGGNIRLLAVAEAGDENQRLHFHAFVHQQHGSKPVGERDLRSKWRGFGCGWLEAKLVDDNPKGAGYVCKYIAKGNEARVRASARYGKRSVAIVKRDAFERNADHLKTNVQQTLHEGGGSFFISTDHKGD